MHYGNTMETQNKLNDRSIRARGDHRDRDRRGEAVPHADAFGTMANVSLHRLCVSRRHHRTVVIIIEHRSNIEFRISNFVLAPAPSRMRQALRCAIDRMEWLRPELCAPSYRDKLSDSQTPERRLRSAQAHKKTI